MSKLTIEMHVGKRYGISRLNCDGTGRVKDVMIDNRRYNRISSQAKKATWRKQLEACLDDVEHVYRTRAIKDVIVKALAARENAFYAEHAEEFAEFIVKNILQCDLKMTDITSQVLVFTDYDINDIVETFCSVIVDQDTWNRAVKETSSKSKKTSSSGILTQIVNGIKQKLPLRRYGVECALFGRMTTSDVMESVDSAVSVNHSYSFGRAAVNDDYFTTIDNYLSGNTSEQSGAGYLDSKEFSTHVYYEYASIDVGLFYENLCKGVDMTDAHNVERIKKIMIEAVKCVMTSIACSAPAGGQNAFASSPDPVGVYITVRNTGMNRTADTCCIAEMNKHNETEEQAFINAMTAFIASDFAADTYIRTLYVGEHAEDIPAEHVNWHDAVKDVGEMIDERF